MCISCTSSTINEGGLVTPFTHEDFKSNLVLESACCYFPNFLVFNNDIMALFVFWLNAESNFLSAFSYLFFYFSLTYH